MWRSIRVVSASPLLSPGRVPYRPPRPLAGQARRGTIVGDELALSGKVSVVIVRLHGARFSCRCVLRPRRDGMSMFWASCAVSAVLAPSSLRRSGEVPSPRRNRPGHI